MLKGRGKLSSIKRQVMEINVLYHHLPLFECMHTVEKDSRGIRLHLCQFMRLRFDNRYHVYL